MRRMNCIDPCGRPIGPTRPLIRLRQVTRVYGTDDAAVRALGGVDLRIDDGEFVAVMGPSGSGKSTCVNILGCLDTATSGVYDFKGIDVCRLSQRQRALLRRHYFGFVFQGYHLLNRASAVENVELPLLYRGLRAGARRAAALAALAAVGLRDRHDHSPAQLSGGQQQRVAIARAIVARPSVLFADEPTGNLDTARSREILELLVDINRTQGVTVVMVTHEEDMAAYARRIVRFRDGRVQTDERRTAAA